MAVVNNILQFRPGRQHFWLAAMVVVAIMFVLSQGAAINIDEILHNKQAQKVVDWYLSLGTDQSCLNTGNLNLQYYGQSADNLSALFNRIFSIENEFATRHLVGWMFASLLLIGTGLLAKVLTGNYGIAILALVLLAVSPRPMGQAFGNLKDIPFAAGYAWSLFFMVQFLKSLPKPRWRDTWLLGLAVAFTNSIRIGGLVLLAYFGLFLIVWFLLQNTEIKNSLKKTALWRPLILKIGVVFLAGYFLSLVFWPYGLMNPLRNPLQALSVMEHYKVSIKQTFEGVQVWSTNLPWYYLPKWMVISIPEIVIAGILAAICFLFIKGVKRDKFLPVGLVGFAFLFPLIYVLVIKANLYSGWRQMYFVYIPAIIVSAIGLSLIYRSLKNSKSKIAVIGLTAGLLLLPIVHTARTYPSEYIYFNALAGTSKECWQNYEYDYYRHEMKKAAGWLRQELSNSDLPVTVASNFDISVYFQSFKNIDYKYIHFYDKLSVAWDYALLGVNYVHPYQLKNGTWQPAGTVKTFYHKGNPTVVILKGQDKNAFEGYTALQNGEFSKAAGLLSKARANDPTDLNILAYLGESYLAINDLAETKRIIENGQKLNPYYEPFLLLEARSFIKDGNYSKGLEVLQNLVKINPRYFQARPYLIDCYEKTGDTIKANQLRIYSDV
jgi:hypothetical protein